MVKLDFMHFVLYVLLVVIFPLIVVVSCFFGDYVVKVYRFIKSALISVSCNIINLVNNSMLQKHNEHNVSGCTS